MLDSTALFESDRLQKQDEYATSQKKTFTKWVNVQLAKVNTSIDDLYTGLQDGIKLIKLVEVIANVRLSKPNTGRILFQKIENVNIALKYIMTKVVLLNIAAEDIVEGNKRLTLGLIWTLIARFQIQELKLMPEESQEKTSVKEALLLWCKRKTKDYKDVQINDFNKSWRDGLAFGALIHSEATNLYDYEVIRQSKKPVESMNMVFEMAEKKLGIPRLLDAEDIAVDNPDEKSILTYISSVYHTFSRIKTENTSARRIGKILDQARGVQEMINEYEKLTENLLAWIQRKSSDFQMELNQKLSNRLSDIQDACQKIAGFRSKVKPEKFEILTHLDELLFKIHSEQKTLKHALYIPRVEGQRLNFINSSWSKMETYEVQYDLKLKDHLVHLEKLEAEANLFYKQTNLRKNWLAESQLVYENIRNDLFNDIDARKEAKLTGILAKKVNAFVVAIEAKTNQFNEINVKGQNLIKAGYWNVDKVEECCTNLSTTWRTFRNEKIPELQSLTKVLVRHNQVYQDLERNSMDLLELTNRLTNPTKGELINTDTSALVLSPTSSSVIGNFSDGSADINNATGFTSTSLSGEQIIKTALERHFLAQKDLAGLKNRIIINCDYMEHFWKDLSTKNSAYFSEQLKERDLELVTSLKDELSEVTEQSSQRLASLDCQLKTMEIIAQMTSHNNSLGEHLFSLNSVPVKPIEMARNLSILHREIKRHKMQINDFYALKLETSRLSNDVNTLLKALSDNRNLLAIHRKKITTTIQAYSTEIEGKETQLQETLDQKARLIHDCQESAVFYSEINECLDWLNEKHTIIKAILPTDPNTNETMPKSPFIVFENFEPILKYGLSESITKALMNRQDILKRELITFEENDIQRLTNITKLLTQPSKHQQNSMTNPSHLSNVKFNTQRMAIPFPVNCTTVSPNSAITGQVNMIEPRVIAVHDYQARDDRKRDIGLKTGELLVLIHKSNDEWWRVRKLNKDAQEAWSKVQHMYETAHETNLSSEDLKLRQADLMYGYEGFAPADFLKEVATGKNSYRSLPRNEPKRTPLQNITGAAPTLTVNNDSFVPSMRNPDNLHFDKENIRKELTNLVTSFENLMEQVEVRDEHLSGTLKFHGFIADSNFLDNWLNIQMTRLEHINEAEKTSTTSSADSTDIARIAPKIESLRVSADNIPQRSLYYAKTMEILADINQKWNQLNEMKNSLSKLLINDHACVINSIESINMLIEDRLAKLNAIKSDCGNEVTTCRNYLRAHKNMEIEMNVAKQKCDEVNYMTRGYEPNEFVQTKIIELKGNYQRLEDEMTSRHDLLQRVLKRLVIRDRLDELSSELYLLEDDLAKFSTNLLANNHHQTSTKHHKSIPQKPEIKRRNSSMSRATRYTLTNVNSVENLLTNKTNIEKLSAKIQVSQAHLRESEKEMETYLADDNTISNQYQEQFKSNKQRLNILESLVEEKQAFIAKLLAAQGIFKSLNVITNSFENILRRLDTDAKLSSLSDVTRERNQLTNIKYSLVKDLDNLEELRGQISATGFIGVTNNELTEQCTKASSLAAECQERIRLAETFINNADERIQTKMLISELEETLGEKKNDLVLINSQLNAIDKEISEVSTISTNRDLITRKAIKQKYLDQVYRKILRLNEIKEESKRNQDHLNKIDIKNPQMHDSRKMTCNPEKLTLMLARMNVDWVNFDENIEASLRKAETIKADLLIAQRTTVCMEKLSRIQDLSKVTLNVINSDDQQDLSQDIAIRARLSQNNKLSSDCSLLKNELNQVKDSLTTVNNKITADNINSDVNEMEEILSQTLLKITENTQHLNSSAALMCETQTGSEQLSWIKERNKKLLRMNSLNKDEIFNPLEITNQTELELYEKKLKTLTIEAKLREPQINQIISSTKGTLVSDEITSQWQLLQANLASYLDNLTGIRCVIEVRQRLIELHSIVTEKQLAMYSLLNRAEKSVNIEPKRIEARLTAVQYDLINFRPEIDSTASQANEYISRNDKENTVNKLLIRSLAEHNQLLEQIFSQTLAYLQNSISQLKLLDETNQLTDMLEEHETKFNRTMSSLENVQQDLHLRLLDFDPTKWLQTKQDALGLLKATDQITNQLKESVARISTTTSRNTSDIAKNQSAAFTSILNDRLEELMINLKTVETNKETMKKFINQTGKNVNDAASKKTLLVQFINMNCQLEDQIVFMKSEKMQTTPKDSLTLEKRTKDHLRLEALSVPLQHKRRDICQKYYALGKLDQDDLLLSFNKMQMNWNQFLDTLGENRETLKRQEEELLFKENSSRLISWTNEVQVQMKNIELDCQRAKDIYQSNIQMDTEGSRRLIDPKVIDDWRLRLTEMQTVEAPLWENRLVNLIQTSEAICEVDSASLDNNFLIQQRTDQMVNQLRATKDSIDRSSELLDQISRLLSLQRDLDSLSSMYLREINAKLTNLEDGITVISHIADVERSLNRLTDINRQLILAKRKAKEIVKFSNNLVAGGHFASDFIPNDIKGIYNTLSKFEERIKNLTEHYEKLERKFLWSDDVAHLNTWLQEELGYLNCSISDKIDFNTNISTNDISRQIENFQKQERIHMEVQGKTEKYHELVHTFNCNSELLSDSSDQLHHLKSNWSAINDELMKLSPNISYYNSLFSLQNLVENLEKWIIEKESLVANTQINFEDPIHLKYLIEAINQPVCGKQVTNEVIKEFIIEADRVNQKLSKEPSDKINLDHGRTQDYITNMKNQIENRWADLKIGLDAFREKLETACIFNEFRETIQSLLYQSESKQSQAHQEIIQKALLTDMSSVERALRKILSLKADESVLKEKFEALKVELEHDMDLVKDRRVDKALSDAIVHDIERLENSLTKLGVNNQDGYLIFSRKLSTLKILESCSYIQSWCELTDGDLEKTCLTENLLNSDDYIDIGTANLSEISRWLRQRNMLLNRTSIKLNEYDNELSNRKNLINLDYNRKAEVLTRDLVSCLEVAKNYSEQVVDSLSNLDKQTNIELKKVSAICSRTEQLLRTTKDALCIQQERIKFFNNVLTTRTWLDAISLQLNRVDSLLTDETAVDKSFLTRTIKSAVANDRLIDNIDASFAHLKDKFNQDKSIYTTRQYEKDSDLFNFIHAKCSTINQQAETKTEQIVNMKSTDLLVRKIANIEELVSSKISHIKCDLGDYDASPIDGQDKSFDSGRGSSNMTFIRILDPQRMEKLRKELANIDSDRSRTMAEMQRLKDILEREIISRGDKKTSFPDFIDKRLQKIIDNISLIGQLTEEKYALIKFNSCLYTSTRKLETFINQVDNVENKLSSGQIIESSSIHDLQQEQVRNKESLEEITGHLQPQFRKLTQEIEQDLQTSTPPKSGHYETSESFKFFITAKQSIENKLFEELPMRAKNREFTTNIQLGFQLLQAQCNSDLEWAKKWLHSSDLDMTIMSEVLPMRKQLNNEASGKLRRCLRSLSEYTVQLQSRLTKMSGILCELRNVASINNNVEVSTLEDRPLKSERQLRHSIITSLQLNEKAERLHRRMTSTFLQLDTNVKIIVYRLSTISFINNVFIRMEDSHDWLSRQRISRDDLHSKIASCTNLDNAERHMTFMKDLQTSVESQLKTSIGSIQDDVLNLFEVRTDELLLNSELTKMINENLRHYLDKHNMEMLAETFASVKFLDQNVGKIREKSIDHTLQNLIKNCLENEMAGLHKHYHDLLDHLANSLMVIETRNEKLSCQFAYTDFIDWLEKEEAIADSNDFGENWIQCQTLYQDYNTTISGNILSTGASRLNSLNLKMDELNGHQEKVLTDLKSKLILSQNSTDLSRSMAYDYKWMIDFIEVDQSELFNKQAFLKLKWTELVGKVQSRKTSLANALEVHNFARDIDDLNVQLEKRISDIAELSANRQRLLHDPTIRSDSPLNQSNTPDEYSLLDDGELIEKQLNILQHEINTDLQPKVKALLNERDRLTIIHPNAKAFINSVWSEIDDRWMTLVMDVKESLRETKNCSLLTDWLRQVKKISDWLKLHKLSLLDVNNGDINNLPKDPNDADQLVNVYETQKANILAQLKVWRDIERRAGDVSKMNPGMTEEVEQKILEINCLWDDMERDMEKKTLIYRKNADVRKLFANFDELEAWLTEEEQHTREHMLNWLGYQLEYESSEQATQEATTNNNLDDALDEHSQLIRKLRLMEDRLRACQRLSEIELEANTQRSSNDTITLKTSSNLDLLSDKNIQKLRHKETVRMSRSRNMTNEGGPTNYNNSLPDRMTRSEDFSQKETSQTNEFVVVTPRNLVKKPSFSSKARPTSVFMPTIAERGNLPDANQQIVAGGSSDVLMKSSKTNYLPVVTGPVMNQSNRMSLLHDLESMHGPVQIKYLTDLNGKKLANPKWTPSSSKQAFYWALLCEKTHNIHRATVQLDKIGGHDDLPQKTSSSVLFYTTSSSVSSASRHPFRLKLSTLDSNSTLKPVVMLLSYPTHSQLLEWLEAIRINSGLSPDRQLMIPIEVSVETKDVDETNSQVSQGPTNSELLFLHKSDARKTSIKTSGDNNNGADEERKDSQSSIQGSRKSVSLLPGMMMSQPSKKSPSTSRFSLSRLANSLRKSPNANSNNN